jgi:hypothetical protein
MMLVALTARHAADYCVAGLLKNRPGWQRAHER